MKELSILLVDDHKLFREGLGLLLRNLSFISEVREAADGNEFLKLLDNDYQPDVVFLDIDMPGLSGIEAARKATKQFPSLNIIALSMYSDEHYYTPMIEAGAKGFILKNSGIHDVEAAILHVMEGKNYFSQEILEGLLKNINRKPTNTVKSDLSDREEEVLYQICKGHSNQEIADILHISKRTVDKHRENLLSKTGSNNTAGLVMYAIIHGIVDV